jgi:N utilization substance protein A
MLEGLAINADDANAIIMAARVTAGWVEAPPVVEEVVAEAEPAEEATE